MQMIHDDSGFTTFDTAWPHFWCGARPIPKTVQSLLRHADVKTTLQLYAHAVSEDRMVAQGQMLNAMLQSKAVN